MEERKSVLVKLGEDSDLKVDLNLGVISLLVAKESYFQPHICLNEKSGVEVIKKISQNSEKANTEIWINEFAILSFDDIWLNIKFCVSLNEISFPNNMVYLTPRQTGYIVRNLKPESKVIVLEKIKRWYFEEFLVKTKKGFDTISKQFNEGDPFIESDHENRIFDIHGDRKMEVPYTEWTIMGNLLAPSFLFGVTCFDHGDIDGYKRADNFLRALDDHRKGAIDLALGLIKNFKE